MMNEPSHAKRQILRSTSIIGGGTAAGLVIGLLRMKLLAALLGPAGIGILGLLNALLTTGVSVGGMAVDTTGVRQLAAASSDPDRERIAWWGLWSFAWPLALIAMFAFITFQRPIAAVALGANVDSAAAAWIGIGVAATILGSARLAAIQAYRRIGDIARIKVASAILASAVSVSAVYFYGRAAAVAAVIAVPIATGLMALWYGRSVTRFSLRPAPTASQLTEEWKVLLTLGIVISISAAIGNGGQLFARTILANNLGLTAAGLFQASFSISSLNMTLVLGAMIPNFYPRISAAVGDPERFSRIINDQVHIALVLAAPMLTIGSVAAPLLLRLLYSDEFAGADTLLRVQLIGDAMRVLGWALGFALLARTARWSYLIVEAAFTAIFLPVLLVALPHVGLIAAGVAYVIAYAATLWTSLFLCARHRFVTIEPQNLKLLATLVLALFVIAGIQFVSTVAAIGIGGAAGIGFTVYSLRELNRLHVFAAISSRLNL